MWHGIVCSVIIRMLTIDVDSLKNQWVYMQTVYNVYKRLNNDVDCICFARQWTNF